MCDDEEWEGDGRNGEFFCDDDEDAEEVLRSSEESEYDGLVDQDDLEREWSQLSTAERAALSRSAAGRPSLHKAWERLQPIEFILVTLTLLLLHGELSGAGYRGDLVVDPASTALNLDPEVAAAGYTVLLFALPEHWHYAYQLGWFGGDDPASSLPPGRAGWCCVLVGL